MDEVRKLSDSINEECKDIDRYGFCSLLRPEMLLGLFSLDFRLPDPGTTPLPFLPSATSCNNLMIVTCRQN